MNMISFNDITRAGYTQYVEIDLGSATMIIMSGQVAIDAEGNTVGKGNFEQQAEFIFSSIKKIVEKAGGSINNVIKLNNYLTDISNLTLFKNVRDRYVNTSQPPASTTVEISRFIREDLLLEIEVIAMINKS
ncbi:RidA family protein [Mucilaginibacter kameinonensis]|uniref:RidA family protein n=1 Tax=Mucilaginibacter kameinonensis TaxID=452286 RepID=UPI001ABFDE6D|nr:RidA family protein [Mucilaginibacter kameinonensis]